MDPTAQESQNRRLKARLRAELRSRRRGLSRAQRKAADQRLCENIRRVTAFRCARNVAAFIAFDGEPSLADLYDNSTAGAPQICVPVIRDALMTFAPLAARRGMGRNYFGILEPRHRRRILTRDLDVVLVPLVGFDDQGNRLGMGGGFYDRHFSFLKSRKAYFRPRLIGVAYEFQKVAEVPADPWDVPLSAIVTDRGIHKSSRSSTF